MSSASYCGPPLQLRPTWLDAQRNFKRVQYTSLSFSVRFREVGFKPLMERAEIALDNAMADIFVWALKAESVSNPPIEGIHWE